MEEAPASAPVDAQVEEGDKQLVLDLLETVDIQSVSCSAVLRQLQETHGRSFNKQLAKDSIAEFIQRHVAAEVSALESAGAAEDDSQEEEDDSQEEEEEDSEEEAPAIAFTDEWSAEFNEIVWVKTAAQWPWWPAIITNPYCTNKKVQGTGLRAVGKKHTVYYYKNGLFDTASPAQMRPFLAFKAEAMEANVPKKFAKYAAEIDQGIILATEDLDKPKDERITSGFGVYRAPSKKRKRSAAPKKESAPAKAQKAATRPTKKPKAAETSALGTLSIPKPASAPGVADSNTAMPSAKPAEKRKLVAVAPAAKKSKSTEPVSDRKANGEPKKPVEEVENDSDGEVEFDFDDRKSDGDEEYVDEPRKKKAKSSSGGEPKRERSDKTKSSSSSETKKPKSSSSSSSSGSKSKTHSTSKDKPKSSSSSSAKLPPVAPLKASSKAAPPKPPPAAARAPSVPADETNEMRARRMVGLLTKCGQEEKQSGSTPALKDKILKYMEKLQQMKLTIEEMVSSQAAEVINQWRRHADVDVSNKAKAIRSIWKENAQKAAAQNGSGAAPAVAAAETVAPPVAPVADAPVAAVAEELQKTEPLPPSELVPEESGVDDATPAAVDSETPALN